MKHFKITIWKYKEEIFSETVEFETFEQADAYSKGLFGGLLFAGKEPTGRKVSIFGNYVAVGIKDDIWTVLSTPTEKDEAEKFVDCKKEDEEFAVKTIQEVRDHIRVAGREYLD
jgi:hypothetical protein